MNLLQIATAIGQRLGVPTSDPTSRDGAACRAFIQLRHDQLYRGYLWKDSLIELALTADPTVAYVPNANFMPTKGNIILPPIFGQVIACRSSTNTMSVERPMLYYRIDPDAFNRSGSPYKFMLLSSCVWEFDTILDLGLTQNNAADAASVATSDLLAADGVTLNRAQTTLAAALNDLGLSDRVDTLLKPTTQGAVALQCEGVNVVTMQAGDISAPKCQRIKLVGSLVSAASLRVLGKRTVPTMAAETDNPGVNGMDGILFALAYYDMCFRRQRGGMPEVRAALVEAVGTNYLTRGMAGGFLGKLIEEEVVQAASNSRIIPDSGFEGNFRGGLDMPDKSSIYGW